MARVTPVTTDVRDVEEPTVAIITVKPGASAMSEEGQTALERFVDTHTNLCAQLYERLQTAGVVVVLLGGLVLASVELYVRLSTMSNHMLRSGDHDGDTAAALLMLEYEAGRA